MAFSRNWSSVSENMRISKEFAFFFKNYLDNHAISCQRLADHYGLDGRQLQRWYKEYLSNYRKWDQLCHASVSVLCYKYKTLSNGEHPFMLRVYKDSKRKLVSLGISVQYNFGDFDKNEPKLKFPNRDLIQKIILDKKVE